MTPGHRRGLHAGPWDRGKVLAHSDQVKWISYRGPVKGDLGEESERIDPPVRSAQPEMPRPLPAQQPCSIDRIDSVRSADRFDRSFPCVSSASKTFEQRFGPASPMLSQPIGLAASR